MTELLEILQETETLAKTFAPEEDNYVDFIIYDLMKTIRKTEFKALNTRKEFAEEIVQTALTNSAPDILYLSKFMQNDLVKEAYKHPDKKGIIDDHVKDCSSELFRMYKQTVESMIEHSVDSGEIISTIRSLVTSRRYNRRTPNYSLTDTGREVLKELGYKSQERRQKVQVSKQDFNAQLGEIDFVEKEKKKDLMSFNLEKEFEKLYS